MGIIQAIRRKLLVAGRTGRNRVHAFAFCTNLVIIAVCSLACTIIADDARFVIQANGLVPQAGIRQCRQFTCPLDAYRIAFAGLRMPCPIDAFLEAFITCTFRVIFFARLLRHLADAVCAYFLRIARFFYLRAFFAHDSGAVGGMAFDLVFFGVAHLDAWHALTTTAVLTFCFAIFFDEFALFAARGHAANAAADHHLAFFLGAWRVVIWAWRVVAAAFAIFACLTIGAGIFSPAIRRTKFPSFVILRTRLLPQNTLRIVEAAVG